MVKKLLLKNTPKIYTEFMTKILALFALLFAVFPVVALADSVKLKIPAINGKILTNNLELTDLKSVLNCRFNDRGVKKEILRYPYTQMHRVDVQVYQLKIKPAVLAKNIPRADLIRCSYKLTLIGKNITTRQLAFGEIVLFGRENGTMSESEMQSLQDSSSISKMLLDKTREISIAFGKEGGIVEEN